MYASRITISSWNTAKRFDETIEKPDLEAVESAVRKLEGKGTTEVTFEADKNTYLILGGGSGRYVGFIARSDGEIHNLVNPAGSVQQQIELCVGGQTGYYTERQCIDLETAIQAARTFSNHGEFDKSVIWEVQK